MTILESTVYNRAHKRRDCHASESAAHFSSHLPPYLLVLLTEERATCAHTRTRTRTEHTQHTKANPRARSLARSLARTTCACPHAQTASTISRSQSQGSDAHRPQPEHMSGHTRCTCIRRHDPRICESIHEESSVRTRCIYSGDAPFSIHPYISAHALEMCVWM